MPDFVTILSDAPDGVPSRIPIAVVGDFSDSRYGDFSIRASDAAEWEQNRQHLPGKRILVDADHKADKPSPNRDTRALAWVDKVEPPDVNGVIYGRVSDVTGEGKKVFGDGTYSFTSAVFGKYKNERGQNFGNVLSGISATNRPFITGLPTIQLASEDVIARAVAAGDSELKAVAAERAVASHELVAPAASAAPVDSSDAMAIALAAGARLGDVRALASAPTVPAPNGGTVRTTPAGVLMPKRSYTLDDSPRELMQDHGALDHLVRTLSSATHRPYGELLMALSSVASASTIRGALGSLRRVGVSLGVKELEAAETELRELVAPDSQSVRLLDAEGQIAADQDERGRVQLDRGFDVAGYRFDELAQARDWERAKVLSSYYAGSSRERFDEDNMLHLDAGLSLVKSLERPGQREMVRRALAVAPAASSAPSVRTLDSGEPVRFVSLDANGMLRALELWDQRGHDQVTLDQCASAVSGLDDSPHLGSPDRLPGVPAGPRAAREDVHRKILEFQKENPHASYTAALAAVTGHVIGGGPLGTHL